MEGARSGRPLLAASARRRAGVLLAGCAVLVAVLGVLFARQSTADRFDRAVDSPLITGFAGHPALALRLAYPGTTIPAIVLSVVIAAACLITRQLRGAVLAAAAVVVGVIAVRFHYFTDTVAGAAVGVGTVCGLALILDLIPAVRPSRIPRRSAAT